MAASNVRGMKLRLLGWADTVGHKVADPYCQATLFGHHLPGWDWLQVGLHHICCAYENRYDERLRSVGGPE